MIDLKVEVGGREVIATGALTTGRGPENIIFKLHELTVEVRFVTREGATEPGIEGESKGDRTLIIRLINFDNTLGTSYDSVVGTYQNKKLHFAFTTSLIGSVTDGRRDFSYTFSVGGDA